MRKPRPQRKTDLEVAELERDLCRVKVDLGTMKAERDRLVGLREAHRLEDETWNRRMSAEYRATAEARRELAEERQRGALVRLQAVMLAVIVLAVAVATVFVAVLFRPPVARPGGVPVAAVAVAHPGWQSWVTSSGKKLSAHHATTSAPDYMGNRGFCATGYDDDGAVLWTECGLTSFTLVVTR